jgi:hypothetical protein
MKCKEIYGRLSKEYDEYGKELHKQFTEENDEWPVRQKSEYY